MSRRILVTGASGFIGGRLVARLRSEGDLVFAPTRGELDLTQAQQVAAGVAFIRPEIILHLASPAMRMLASGDIAMIECEVATTAALALAAPPGTRFIQAGSMAQYGRSGRHAEDDPCTPISAYGRAKLAAEDRLNAVAAARQLDASVARIFGAYGHGEAPQRLFQHILLQAGGTHAVALSDGLQRRDFVHVDDVCTALIGLSRLSGALQPAYNVGTGVAVSVRSAVERIAGELGLSGERLDFGAIARSPLDEDCLEADTTRLGDALNWVPPQRFLAAEPVLPLLN